MEPHVDRSGQFAMADYPPDVAPRNRLASFGQSAECQIIRDTFALLGDKWSLLIVRILAEGTFRFGELHRIVVGISQRMLTLTLRNLERDGLVSRTIYPEVPPRVDYQLTALGRTLVEPVSALSAWALAHHAEIERHRASASSPLSSRSGGGVEEGASPGGLKVEGVPPSDAGKGARGLGPSGAQDARVRGGRRLLQGG